jgi:hypothetical protein
MCSKIHLKGRLFQIGRLMQTCWLLRKVEVPRDQDAVGLRVHRIFEV